MKNLRPLSLGTTSKVVLVIFVFNMVVHCICLIAVFIVEYYFLFIYYRNKFTLIHCMLHFVRKRPGHLANRNCYILHLPITRCGAREKLSSEWFTTGNRILLKLGIR